MKFVALLLLCSFAYSQAIVTLPSTLSHGGSTSTGSTTGSWLADLLKPGSNNFPLIMSKKRSARPRCFLWCPNGQIALFPNCVCSSTSGLGWPFGGIPTVGKRVVALPTGLGGTGGILSGLGNWATGLFKPGSGINFPIIMSKKRAILPITGINCPIMVGCNIGCIWGTAVDANGCSLCACKDPFTGEGWPWGAIPMISKRDLGSAASSVITGIQNWLADLIKPTLPTMVISKRLFGIGSCPLCAVFCPFGQKFDATTGCMTCGCNDSPFWNLQPLAISKRGNEQELVQKPVMPVLCGPVCMIWCPYGNVLNSNGCPTCSCKNAPDGSSPWSTIDFPLMVSKKRAVGPVKPVKPLCGFVCMIWCPFGNVLDSDGCPTCSCKNAPDGSSPWSTIDIPMVSKKRAVGPVKAVKPLCGMMMCMIWCPFGKVLDSDGCQTCSCKNAPDGPDIPGSGWGSKKRSAKQLSSGEQKLAIQNLWCNPHIIGAMPCMIWCPYGNVLNSNGCPLCSCKTAPDGNSPWPNIDFPLMVSKKRAVGPVKAVKPLCGPVCAIWCPFGNVLNSDGCPTCTCNSNPSGTNGFPDFILSKKKRSFAKQLSTK